MKYKIKICGMRDKQNILSVLSLKPDYMGFIFFPGSVRYALPHLIHSGMSFIDESTVTTGVFVDESPEQLLNLAKRFKLQAIQLHGHESPEYCCSVRKAGYKIIKAISVREALDFNLCNGYLGCCDYFLFDTRSELPGGSGQKFNWEVLTAYCSDIPFFLSGGIGPEDVVRIQSIRHPMLYGIDVNSKFEIVPGIKDAEKIKKFMNAINE